MTDRGEWRKGLGAMTAAMMSLWMDPGSGSVDADELPKRIGPGVLGSWTLLAIALGAGLSALKFAFSDDERLVWLAAAAPMLLPLLVAAAYKPARWVVGLAVGGALGVAVGLGAAAAVPSSFSLYWTIFAGLALGTLACSVAFGVITQARQAG